MRTVRNAAELLAWLSVTALAGYGAWVLGVFINRPEPVTVPAPGAVVRVLDVVVRDSNTTNHRQRFECRPVGMQYPYTVKEKSK